MSTEVYNSITTFNHLNLINLNLITFLAGIN